MLLAVFGVGLWRSLLLSTVALWTQGFVDHVQKVCLDGVTELLF